MAKSPEIPTIPVEGFSNGVCMSPIRSSVCSPCIYKINETCSCASSPIWHTPDHLLGRHFVDEPNTYRASLRHFYSPSFAGEPGFCGKLAQISFEPNPDTRVSGISCEYTRYDPCPSPGKGDSNQTPLHSDNVSERSHCSRHSTVNRQANSFYSGNFSSPSPLSPITELEKQSPSIEGDLRYPSQSQSSMSGRTTMVAGSPRCLEWQGHIDSPTRSSDRDQCIETVLGGSMHGYENRGPLVPERTSSTYLLPGAVGRGLCCEMFCKEPDLFAIRLGMYNTTAIAYINKLGRTRSLVLSNLVADLWTWALNKA